MLQSVSVRAMSHRAYCKRNINTTSRCVYVYVYYTIQFTVEHHIQYSEEENRIFFWERCWCGMAWRGKNLTYIGLDEPYILNLHTVSLCLFSDDFISSKTYCIYYLVDSVCLVSIWIGNIYATTNGLCGL